MDRFRLLLFFRAQLVAHYFSIVAMITLYYAFFRPYFPAVLTGYFLAAFIVVPGFWTLAALLIWANIVRKALFWVPKKETNHG